MTMGHDPQDVAEYAYRDLELMTIVAHEKSRTPEDAG
jgi:hypothetical protein